MNYSGFWRRVAASLIDGLILIIPSLAVGAAIPFIGGFIVQFFYKPIFEASPIKATPGKALMGIVVVNAQGQRITIKQSFIRYFSSILSGLLLCLGYLMAAFTARKQTLHDMIADTYVVHEFAPEVNFFTVWLNEMKRLFGALEASSDAAYAGGGSTATGSSSTTHVMTLEQLHKLFQSGALSEAEYNMKKEEILKKI